MSWGTLFVPFTVPGTRNLLRTSDGLPFTTPPRSAGITTLTLRLTLRVRWRRFIFSKRRQLEYYLTFPRGPTREDELRYYRTKRRLSTFERLCTCPTPETSRGDPGLRGIPHSYCTESYGTRRPKRRERSTEVPRSDQKEP